MSDRTRKIVTRGMGRLAPLAAAALLAACGGGAPAPAAPAPAAVTDTGQAAPSVPVVRTDTGQAQVPAPLVYGVNLDTVHAGRFDQGKMWTFEFPPTQYFTETYGFRPDSSWFARARLGALRIPSCSASFVSPNGLVMTNHHCAREFVTQVQKDGEDLLDNGFVATNLADEREVTNFHADQLIEIVDVTDRVNAQLDTVPLDKRFQARKDLLDSIQTSMEAERGGEDAGITVEMVSLYDGARTSAYVFRRYTHAKLVMVPEVQIGFFGGDPDNFTYPRYNLDFSFFRLYDDDGNPVKSDHYFKVDTTGLHQGEPIFIVGNPGSTSRLQTVAQLEFRRDISDRYLRDLLRSRMKVLSDYMESHPEESKAIDLENHYFELSNSEKAYAGQVRGLEDPIILARRQDTQNKLQKAIDADPKLKAQYGDVIQKIADIEKEKRAVKDETAAFVGFGNPFLDASTILRAFWATQVIIMRQNGASADDLKGMEAGLDSVPQLPEGLDAALLAARLQDMVDHLGRGNPAVRRVLQGRTPRAAAQAIVSGSVLSDSAKAVDMVQKGTLSLQDPAVQAMIGMLDPFIRYNNTFADAQQRESSLAAELGRARFQVYGTAVPPDATFSLRIADGVVKGYDYNGTEAPWHTTFYGMYDRHFSFQGRKEWALPPRWATPPAGLDLATSLDFVSTADIIGGNSGSPVLDQNLDVVGLVFDGNIESLPGDYIYLPQTNRSVAVDIRAILEALDDVYDLDRLVLELKTGRLVPTEAAADRVGGR